VAGLFLGNLLAVLSWMLICAPIGTRCRLTLYYQLEKICGRHLVTLYNLANGLMFCFLAGAMVTVSATALGVWFNFPMPALDDMYPNSVGWVLAVAAVGALISIVAAFGYKTVSKFANIAAPWMVLVFLAFGFLGLLQFMNATGTEIKSGGDHWYFGLPK
jgi:amino acid transporter